MFWVLLFVLSASIASAQPRRSVAADTLGGKPTCSATVTANCIPSRDASGNVAIGTTAPSYAPVDPSVLAKYLYLVNVAESFPFTVGITGDSTPRFRLSPRDVSDPGGFAGWDLDVTDGSATPAIYTFAGDATHGRFYTNALLESLEGLSVDRTVNPYIIIKTNGVATAQIRGVDANTIAVTNGAGGTNALVVNVSTSAGAVTGTWQAQGYKSADGSEGWTGTFATGDAKTCTVKNGLITGCS